MVYNSFEFLPRAEISSCRVRPIQRDASGIVATCDMTASKSAGSDPPCGVERKRIDGTDSRICLYLGSI